MSWLILENNITNALFKIQVLRDIEILWGLSECLSVLCAILSRYLHRSGRTPKSLCPGLAAPCQDLWRQKPQLGQPGHISEALNRQEPLQYHGHAPVQAQTKQGRNTLTFLSGMTWTGRAWQTSWLLPSGEVLQRQKHCTAASGGIPCDPAQAASVALPALDSGFSLQISLLGKAGAIQHLGQPHLPGLTQAWTKPVCNWQTNAACWCSHKHWAGQPYSRELFSSC